MLVVMEKYVIGFWIKVPCQKNIGSCTYQNICPEWSQICTALFSQYGVPCNCPIPAGTYTIPDITVEATQTLPPQAVGTFRVYIDLLSGSAGQLGCLEFQINVSN
jgi:ganglioside GM2 activator